MKKSNRIEKIDDLGNMWKKNYFNSPGAIAFFLRIL